MSSSNGLGQQGAGFAGHPRHLPTPVITGTSSEALANSVSFRRMEPRPSQSLPSFRQFVEGSDRGSNIDAASIRGGPSPGSTPTAEAWHGSPIPPRPAVDVDAMMMRTRETLNEQLRANGYDPSNLPISNHPINNPSNQPNANGVYHVTAQAYNPYQERADQIGLTHRIPGIGHLGDLLTPPGWTPGDQPISPDRARRLQQEAYDATKKKLDDSIVTFKHLKGTAFQEASDVNNEEWQNQADLSKLLFEERMRVYQAHENQKANRGQLPPQQSPVLNLPQPNGAYTQHYHPMGIAPARNMQFQGPVPQPLHLMHRSGNYGNPELSPKDLSPSLLDPSLLHGTVQSVMNNYNRKQHELLQMLEDNKARMAQCLERFGPHIRQGYQAQQAPPCPQQVIRRPSTHTGMEVPRLPQVYYEDRGIAAHRYAALPDQNALRIHDEPVELALTPVKDHHYGATPPPDEDPSQDGPVGTPSKQSKKKTPAKKPSPKKPSTSVPKSTKFGTPKKEPWYAADLAAGTAHLGPSNVTLESINALLADDTRDAKIPPAKKRRRPGERVKTPEHQVSFGACKGLFKSSILEGQVRYTGKGANPFLSDGDDGVTNSNNSAPAVLGARRASAPRPRARNVRAKAAGTSASSPLFIDGPCSTATASSNRRRSPSSTTSEYDPKDEDYGSGRKGGVSSAKKGRVVPTKRARKGED